MTEEELSDLYDPLHIPVGATVSEQLCGLAFMVAMFALAVAVVKLFLWVTT